MWITWLAGPAGTPPRVAYAVNRSVGGAVVRNRLRRRLRAAVAELAGTGRVPSGACLVGASPAAVDMTFEELKASVAEALSALSNESAR